MFRKAHGAAALLRDALAPLDRKIDLAFIFGSMARGSKSPRSDVDLMVVGSVDFATLVTALHSLQGLLAREINPVLFSPAEFRERAGQDQGFVKSVIDRPVVFLKGDRNHLAESVGDSPTSGAPR